MKTAVLSVSGGLDSTTLVYHYEAQGFNIHMLSFDYGQRHVRELDSARETAHRLGLVHDVINLRHMNTLISTSALTNTDIGVPEGHYADETMKITVVPNRNAIMLNIAIGVAVAEGASLVGAAMHAGDHAIYPDCRPEFIWKLQELARIANEGFIDPLFIIDAPFVNMTKAQIASRAFTLGVPVANTWSCYNGQVIHCGRCSTCLERMEAIKIAGYEDPTEYEDTELFEELMREGILG